MPKIICTIPGAPAEIGGLSGVIKFAACEGGVSAEVSDDDARHFLSIPGYALSSSESAKSTETKPDPAEDAEFEALLKRAEAVKLDVDKRWRIARLRNEVEHAEAEATKKPAASAESAPEKAADAGAGGEGQK